MRKPKCPKNTKRIAVINILKRNVLWDIGIYTSYRNVSWYAEVCTKTTNIPFSTPVHAHRRLEHGGWKHKGIKLWLAKWDCSCISKINILRLLHNILSECCLVVHNFVVVSWVCEWLKIHFLHFVVIRSLLLAILISLCSLQIWGKKSYTNQENSETSDITLQDIKKLNAVADLIKYFFN